MSSRLKSLAEERDTLDSPARTAARRGWMRSYFRAAVRDRVSGLDELVDDELRRSRKPEGEERFPT